MPDLRLGITIAVNKETGAIDIAGRELEGLAQQATAAGAAAQTGAAGFSALAATLAPLISGAAVVAFFKSATDEALKAQEATSRLTAALKNQGIESDELVRSMEKHASALQQVTRYEDDAILEGQALLVSFGQLGDANARATKAALDLAAGLKIDLAQAFQLVAKASSGQTEALGRYGIKVSEAIPEGQKFAAVLEQVEKRFGGRAQADAETYAGKIDQLKIAFGSLKEKIGTELLPVLGYWLDKLRTAVGLMDRLHDATKRKTGADLADLSVSEASLAMARRKVAALREEYDAIQGGDPIQRWKLAGIAEEIRIQTDLIVKLKEKAEVEKATVKETVDQTVADRQRQAADEAFISEEASQKRQQGMAEEIEVQRRWAVAIQKVKEEDSEKNKKRRKQERDAAIENIGFIAGQTKTGISQLDSVIKAAQIADATRATFQAANKALTAGPFIGPVLAAATIAIGLANVAKISALAEGGRSESPILTTFSEKEPETAVPDSKLAGFTLGVLSAQKSGVKLPGFGGDAGAGGGSGVSIHIGQVTVVSPDPERAGEAVIDALLELAERGGPKVERLGKILEGGAMRFGSRST